MEGRKIKGNEGRKRYMDLYHSKISNSRGEMDGRRKSTRSREYAFVFVLPTSRINSRRGAGFRDTDRRSSMKEGAGGAARGWIRLEMVEETSGKVTDGEKGGAERRRETSVHIFLCHRSRGDALLSRDKGKCGGKIAEERRGAGNSGSGMGVGRRKRAEEGWRIPWREKGATRTRQSGIG